MTRKRDLNKGELPTINRVKEVITIAVLGLDRVGKTSLLRRCLFNDFEPMYTPTVDEMYTVEALRNGTKYSLCMHEMGGARQFPAMRKLIIKKADGFLLVYSTDSKASFEEVKRLYSIIVSDKGRTDVPVVIVGNKSDISLRYISSTDVCSTIRHWGHKVQRIETSAKTDDNCSLVLEKLLTLIDEQRTEGLQLSSFFEMAKSPFHKLLSFFRIPLSFPTFDDIKDVLKGRNRHRPQRRSRHISSSSSNDCTMQLLYVSILPLVADVRDYVNINW